MKKINLIQCGSPAINTLHLELVRLNCLALACLNSRHDENQVILAEVYYKYVMTGENSLLV